jgi:hypothetical protein
MRSKEIIYVITQPVHYRFVLGQDLDIALYAQTYALQKVTMLAGHSKYDTLVSLLNLRCILNVPLIMQSSPPSVSLMPFMAKLVV